MSNLLAFEAERRAVNITINSIGTELTRDDRWKLYTNFGLLVYVKCQDRVWVVFRFDTLVRASWCCLIVFCLLAFLYVKWSRIEVSCGNVDIVSDRSIAGMLPHMAALAYSPVLPKLSGSMKVCHRILPVLASNLARLPRNVQHSSTLRSSSIEDVPT
ncbi:hypothetical protein LWI29_014846 [Acer saccharum]|uniref:Uncharacterized protein n=1 Tax=Acer saccharum TaxID=4024 RepID=A0AA39S3T3_ACESA|nr:hypothetical protein LWI29_014846 [Acer saccharum]